MFFLPDFTNRPKTKNYLSIHIFYDFFKRIIHGYSVFDQRSFVDVVMMVDIIEENAIRRFIVPEDKDERFVDMDSF